MPEIDSKLLTQEMKNRYVLNKNTFITKEKEFETEIGDSKQADFIPQVKIKRWDNETNFSLRLIESDSGTPKLSFKNEKIKWKKDNLECHFYHKPAEVNSKEGFEFEVVFNKKPVSNVVQFSIETKELNYFYQPALTVKEKIRIDRPENVIGSYAVYHKTKKNNYEKIGGQNYKSGKAFHIYRPKIIDSVDNWVWGELNIDVKTKLLTVTIPQRFLDSAVYPVFVDPNIGLETVGSNSLSFGDSIVYSKITMTEAGTLTDITSYTASYKSPTAYHAIYDDSSNPNDLLEEETTGYTPADWAGGGWHTTSMAETTELADATSYWLALVCDEDTEYSFRFFGDVTGGTEREAGTTFPSTAANLNDENYTMSIYATYTAGGGATTYTDDVLLSSRIKINNNSSDILLSARVKAEKFEEKLLLSKVKVPFSNEILLNSRIKVLKDNDNLLISRVKLVSVSDEILLNARIKINNNSDNLLISRIKVPLNQENLLNARISGLSVSDILLNARIKLLGESDENLLNARIKMSFDSENNLNARIKVPFFEDKILNARIKINNNSDEKLLDARIKANIINDVLLNARISGLNVSINLLNARISVFGVSSDKLLNAYISAGNSSDKLLNSRVKAVESNEKILNGMIKTLGNSDEILLNSKIEIEYSDDVLLSSRIKTLESSDEILLNAYINVGTISDILLNAYIDTGTISDILLNARISFNPKISRILDNRAGPGEDVRITDVDRF